MLAIRVGNKDVLSQDAGTMAAMAGSFPPLAIFCDISVRNLDNLPSRPVPTVAPSLRERQRVMVTCFTINASDALSDYAARSNLYIYKKHTRFRITK